MSAPGNEKHLSSSIPSNPPRWLMLSAKGLSPHLWLNSASQASRSTWNDLYFHWDQRHRFLPEPGPHILVCQWHTEDGRLIKKTSSQCPSPRQNTGYHLVSGRPARWHIELAAILSAIKHNIKNMWINHHLTLAAAKKMSLNFHQYEMIHNPNINKPRRSSKFAKAPSCASKGTISISRVKPWDVPHRTLGITWLFSHVSDLPGMPWRISKDLHWKSNHGLKKCLQIMDLSSSPVLLKPT